MPSLASIRLERSYLTRDLEYHLERQAYWKSCTGALDYKADAARVLTNARKHTMKARWIQQKLDDLRAQALSLEYAERGLEDRTRPVRELPSFTGWTDDQIGAYLSA